MCVCVRACVCVLLVLSCFCCVLLCDPMDHSLPGSSVHETLQARILEWVAISFSRDWSPPRDWTWFSYSPALAVRFFTTSTTWEASQHSMKSVSVSSPYYRCILRSTEMLGANLLRTTQTLSNGLGIVKPSQAELWARLLTGLHRWVSIYVLCYAMLSHFSRVWLCVTP